MIEFNNKKILVLGLKKSGRSAIRLLKTLNVEIFVSDEEISVDPEDMLFKGTKSIPYKDVIKNLTNIDLIIKSPGIPYDIEILKKAKQKKVMIISEIELAYQFLDKSKVIVGITGTNGKTTTTSLITQILIDSNIDAISVGNIGYSLCEAIADEVNADVYVIELSSFQLLDVYDFKPHIGVLLNLTEAHLDYHHTFDQYVDAKMNLFKRMTSDCYAIYNGDDKLIRKRMKKVKCNKYAFSLSEIDVETYLENNLIKYNGRTIISVDEVKLPGIHNLYNVLAATTIAKVFYIENEIIKNTIQVFESLPHRIQLIKNINGLTYYNDSKSTNSKSTICAINAFHEPLILILGGYDRNQDFSDIIAHKNVETIITYGQTKDRILASTKLYHKKCFECQELSDAVLLTQSLKKEVEIVLFSPASASWDQFTDYEERGNKFIEFVNSIEKE